MTIMLHSFKRDKHFIAFENNKGPTMFAEPFTFVY